MSMAVKIWRASLYVLALFLWISLIFATCLHFKTPSSGMPETIVRILLLSLGWIGAVVVLGQLLGRPRVE